MHLQLAAVRLGQLPERVAVVRCVTRSLCLIDHSVVSDTGASPELVAQFRGVGGVPVRPASRWRTDTEEDATMLLRTRSPWSTGPAGAIGGAVARAFAAEGATVFLTGAAGRPVEAVAEEIVAESAQAAEVDALDERAVDEHLRSVVEQAGRVDISFNAIGIPDAEILGVPLVDLDVEQFSQPITTYTTSYFLTARLAARQMIRTGRA